MSERYWWAYTGGPADGRSGDFPTQADAEAWFATEWAQVAQDGVSAVTLMREGAEVYGPMPLEAG